MALSELTEVEQARERLEADGGRKLAADHRRAFRMGLFATGRLFLGAPFLVGAIEKALDHDRAEVLMGGLAFDLTGTVPLVVALEGAIGVLITTGWWARRTAAAGIGYVAAALLFVRPDLGTPLGRALAIANLVLVGGLLLVMAHGAGRLSLDHRREARRRRRAAHHQG